MEGKEKREREEKREKKERGGARGIFRPPWLKPRSATGPSTCTPTTLWKK